jgi:type IV secretory pathway VirB9-like protein
MQYTLITNQGRIYSFYLEATALCFQQAYGGVIFSQEILNQETVGV